MFFWSRDSGTTWGHTNVQTDTALLPWAPPFMITSSPAGNVYLFSAWGPNPVLWKIAMTLGATTAATTASIAPYKIVYQQSGAFNGPSAPPGSSGFPDLAGAPLGTMQADWGTASLEGSVGITHAAAENGRDVLMALYPSVSANRQIARVMKLSIDPATFNVVVSSAGNITAAAAGGSVTQATVVSAMFSDLERAGMQAGLDPAAKYAMVYWKESKRCAKTRS
jgi:hypothetical protein